MNFLTPVWPREVDGLDHIGAISTLRTGGFSLPPYAAADGSGGLNLATHVGDDAAIVARNRAVLRLKIPADPHWLNQVHGSAVVHARADAVVENPPTADACIATEPGVVCAILTADCLPVLLCDSKARVVGAAHAGWRGLASGVLQNTVAAMRAVGATDVCGWLGPAIGPKKFEVGEDVRTEFCDGDHAAAKAFEASTSAPGKYMADLYALARLALMQADVSAISGGDRCTVSQPQDYFSYRRDLHCGRMASLIWIR